LKELVGQAVEMVSSFCDECSVKVNDHTGSMPVQGDEERLTQVLANVLRNAIKSSCKGGEVEIESSNEHGWAEVKIKYKPSEDTSSGSIADALAQRSLEVCKEIITLHKGYFGFEDADSSVKNYWLRLPSSSK